MDDEGYGIRRDQQILDRKGWTMKLDFGSVTGIVVTASPRFQEGTIDARDLVNMTNVQISEVRRQTSLHELVNQMASDVYLQAVEAF